MDRQDRNLIMWPLMSRLSLALRATLSIMMGLLSVVIHQASAEPDRAGTDDKTLEQLYTSLMMFSESFWLIRNATLV
jgi:hypothetical protein